MPRSPTRLWLDDPCAVSIMCKAPSVACPASRSLEHQGFHLDAAAMTVVVLDSPRGFALHALATLKEAPRRLIVATGSPCAEYWEDLWDLNPWILLVGRYPTLDLADAIRRAVRGERYRLTPPVTTLLTPTERRVLRMLACGQSNQQIAAQNTWQLQTVKNMLVTIYQKLGFKNRSEALLYYWGIWRSFEHPSQASME